MIEKNDKNENVISMDCYCQGKHCEGNIYIQPDCIKGQKVFMITAIDTKGYDDASLWLTPEQLKQLIDEINILLA